MSRRILAALLALGAGIVLAGGILAGPTGGVTAQEETPTAEPEDFGDIELLGLSPVICTVLTSTKPGASMVDALKCGQMHTQSQIVGLADLHGDGDGRVEPDDFAGIDLDGNQIHQGDDSPSLNGGLWIVAFVPDDDPVTFETQMGRFVPAGSAPPDNPQFPGIDPVDDEYVCDTETEDEDCDADGVAGDGVVAILLRGRWGSYVPDRGEFVVTVTQGVTKEEKAANKVTMPFRIVGEPDSVSFLTLEDTIQNGVMDWNGDDDFGDENECPLATTAKAILAANATAERSVVLGIVKDSDGVAITGAFVLWDTDDNEKAIMAAPLTPTIDLGSFGFGAPNLICGTEKPGKVNVVADITQTQGRGGTGAVLDPSAEQDTGLFEFTVKGVPANLALKAEPEVIACDGASSSKVTATVTDIEGNPVASGTKVRFDVQVLGTANPVNATTNAEGLATSQITPLANAGSGVPVLVTAGTLRGSILVKCGEGAPAGVVAPPPAPSGGQQAAPPTGAPAGRVNLPESGDVTVSGRSALPMWAFLVGGVAAASIIAAGALVRRRADR